MLWLVQWVVIGKTKSVVPVTCNKNVFEDKCFSKINVIQQYISLGCCFLAEMCSVKGAGDELVKSISMNAEKIFCIFTTF